VRVIVWIVLLLIFAVGFLLVMRRHDDTTKSGGGGGAGGGRRGGGGGGPVTLTVATAKKGNIGVYLDAIGTVTPVLYGFDHQPGDGAGDCGALQGGADRAQG